MTVLVLLLVLAIVCFILAGLKVASAAIEFFPLGWAFVVAALAFGGGHI